MTSQRRRGTLRAAAKTPATFFRRLRRGFAVLQLLGRKELFRVETRIELGRLDYPHEDIYLGIDSRYAPMRLRSCAKEPWTVAWIEESMSVGDTIYDVGANVGAYSLIAAKLGRRVVALEPAYASFATLCDNIIVNDLSEMIHPFALMLGEDTGLAFFNYRDVESGAGLHSTGDQPFLKGRFAPVYRQPVLSYRLDDLIEQFDLPEPNHLKLDVDGSELNVLRGGPRGLSRRSLRSVMVEVNQEEGDEVVSLLRGFGLELHRRHEPVSTHGHWYGHFARP